MKALRISIACVSVLVALTACSSTGGKPRTTADGMGSGQADTPRFTIAMVTHGPPGDTFWDLIRKGAESAASWTSWAHAQAGERKSPRHAGEMGHFASVRAEG